MDIKCWKGVIEILTNGSFSENSLGMFDCDGDKVLMDKNERSDTEKQLKHGSYNTDNPNGTVHVHKLTTGKSAQGWTIYI